MEVGADGYRKGGALDRAQWRTELADMPAGRLISQNTLPPGFLAVQNFLAPAVSSAIINAAELAPRAKHTILETAAGSMPTESVGRNSECIDSAHISAVNIGGLVRAAFVSVIAPHFGRKIQSVERPEILRYEVGGEYRPHADADNWDGGAQKWLRTLDRDLSLLIYLNDNFEGGEIAFPNFAISMKPQNGLLIAFPSDFRYLHAALPVRAGKRYALVSWAKAEGSVSVEPTRRPAVEPV